MDDPLNDDPARGGLVETLADVAEAAAAVILPYWRNGVAAETKSDDSPVTRADREAEALILARLAAWRPEVPAVAEEQAAAHGLPAVAPERFWLIDPLDGTRGFVAGREAFTVNIALIEGGRPVAGVVSAPALGETWAGQKGGGAFKRRFGGDWRAIRVRARPQTALALFSRSLSETEGRRLGDIHGCARWEGLESSLKFCLIAEGLYDLYPREGPTSEWDTAAGQAVLEAAGGRVLDAAGRPFAYGKPGFLNGPFTALGG